MLCLCPSSSGRLHTTRRCGEPTQLLVRVAAAAASGLINEGKVHQQMLLLMTYVLKATGNSILVQV